jgi:superfamily II DNA helicase RecQ
VLLQLATNPPRTAAALADVPGVGAALAARLGGAILGALEALSEQTTSTEQGSLPTSVSLRNWRAGVAHQMGIPAYLVLTDAMVRAVAEASPRTREDLARVRGIGPRLLGKFGDDLLALVNGSHPR